ncbi:uncharacterized protein TRIADDRAFT_50087 [Trichoplax adhaerens]|uniref:Nicotinate-nucleotide pyrophosphorylase [carboxylating] n=1 Tax=Trichoplax adhaerens TaxID=10228 RepID=B3RT84_TRIAD|nr:hypothetical protein TRIADDRAFT_50087 [Trichoplax adhaerens]EDV26653.1 hypothetical protein TRIADDRAFT_50087 [Trichoplax adhaerens]|eukprot:XP_002110649.1 hypothetical protein TRIADDRAFT_50087 [Trichoplax adhaerens]
MDYKNLVSKVLVESLVNQWIQEDIPNFDYGGYVVGEKVETAVLLCKSEGVIAGQPFVQGIYDKLGCQIQWKVEEGTLIQPIAQVAQVQGPVNKILMGERISLNCICRASGIATRARYLHNLAKSAQWHGEIAGTRKTTPGFRTVEKYSLLVGGISTHRFNLSSMVMLKDNHIWSVGNIEAAVKKARQACGFSTKIEVECRSLEEGCQAAKAGADIIMLDNFEPDALHRSAAALKVHYPHVLVEASGGITVDTINSYFVPNVDVISLSSTIQGCPVVDFSLKILKEETVPRIHKTKT